MQYKVCEQIGTREKKTLFFFFENREKKSLNREKIYIKKRNEV